MSSANEKYYSLPANCDFTKLRGGDEVSNSCSPQLIDDNYRGIIINGPKEVIWPKGADIQLIRIPVLVVF